MRKASKDPVEPESPGTRAYHPEVGSYRAEPMQYPNAAYYIVT